MSLPVAPSLLASLQDPGQPDAAAHGLLPELSVADLAMSLSPKHHQLQLQHHQLQQHHQQSGQVGQVGQHPHSTPFSVTDILSPMDEFRKVELSGAGSSSSSAGTPAPNPASYVQFPPQYCAPELAAYGDVRGPAAGWYGTATDPRFASECVQEDAAPRLRVCCVCVCVCARACEGKAGGAVK